jgi:hypothetical protein
MVKDGPAWLVDVLNCQQRNTLNGSRPDHDNSGELAIQPMAGRGIVVRRDTVCGCSRQYALQHCPCGACK